jgi:hypothetical protein
MCGTTFVTAQNVAVEIEIQLNQRFFYPNNREYSKKTEDPFSLMAVSTLERIQPQLPRR